MFATPLRGFAFLKLTNTCPSVPSPVAFQLRFQMSPFSVGTA